MRAREFVQENDTSHNRGKLTKRQQQPTRGMHIFTDNNFDRLYVLNRVMMAAASSNGIEKPILDSESWSAKTNTAHPYTEIEQEMLKHAYQAVGIPYTDLNHGDMDSEELDSTNTQSPIKPFKGL